MVRFIDETAAQKCLTELMARRGVKSWLKTAFDACDIEQLLADTPTVEDAVEVVRCKDCKHFNMRTMECENDAVSTDHEGGASYSLNFYLDDFCSYGERREDDA